MPAIIDWLIWLPGSLGKSKKGKFKHVGIFFAQRTYEWQISVAMQKKMNTKPITNLSKRSKDRDRDASSFVVFCVERAKGGRPSQIWEMTRRRL